MNRSYHIRLLILMLIATGISIIAIYRQSIRLDESQSLWASAKSVPAILTYISQDVHVPLYHIILHFWIKVFDNSIIMARTLSLLFFVLTIPVLFHLSRESSNERIAWLTVFLFSLSPFMLWFSAETRMYTLFTLVSVVNHLYFMRFFRGRKGRNEQLYLLTVIIGLYTHYFFLLQIVCQGIYGIAIAIAGPKTVTLQARTTFFRHWLMLIAVAGVFFAPWLVYVWQQGGSANAAPNIPTPNLYTVFQAVISFLFGFPAQTIQTIMISVWPVLMILLLLLFTKNRLQPIQSMGYFLLVSIAPIILVYSISIIRPVFLARYLIFTIPTFLFILSWSLFHLARRREMLLYISVIVVMVSLLIYQNLSSSNPVREDYQTAARFLSHEATYHDIISASAPFTVYPLEYSYQGQARITTIPQWNRYEFGPIPAFNYTDLYQQLSDFETRYDRMFLVLSYDQGYETELVNYLNANYRILQRLDFGRSVRIHIYDLRKN